MLKLKLFGALRAHTLFSLLKPTSPVLHAVGGFFKPPTRYRWIVLLLSLVCGCTPTRLLPPGRNLLRNIKLKGVDQSDPARLEALYQQRPNSRFPLPKLTIYQLGSTFYNRDKVQKRLDEERLEYRKRIQAARPDSVKVGKLLVKRDQHLRRHQLVLDKGNAIMRLGEAPVLYDSALTAKTVEQMSILLKSEGFFRGRVTATDSVRKRMVTVTYQVTENTPFTYSQLDYDIPDSAVARVVRADQQASLLKVGQRYDEAIIGQERNRLETLLKNAGYFDFREQYITLEADTSFAPYTVRLRTLIANPAPGVNHRVYSIRHVNFLTDAGTVRFGVKRDTIERDSVYYLAFQHRFSTRILDRKLTVRPEQRYSLTNTQLTQRQLADLDVFRFNNVNYVKVEPTAATDSTNYQLDAVVNASPHKRFQELTEFGATYVAEQVGPFVNARLKVRNVFGGAEVLEFGVRAGFEGQYNRVTGSDIPQTVLTTQLGGNVNLVIPQFLVPWRTGRMLSRYNPRTRLNVTYTYVQRPEYTRTNLEGTFDYIWQRSLYHQFVLTPFDVSIINASAISDSFQVRLNRLAQEGSPLFRSFTQLYVPSINATSLYNSNDFNQTRDATFLRLFAEVGGLTRSLYQDRINLNVYDFAKLTADYRRYHKLGPKTFFVYRFNGGIARALTRTDVEDADGNVTGSQLIIPYDKYLFAGGSSSVRAWKPRRLGPGAYTTTRVDDGVLVRDYNLEQPGELLLEANVEYRFPIYSFINGAVFTDAGNVWTLQSDPRPNAQFKPDQFLTQFAVGSGVGIRLDFSFLILRFDVATKVYDPTAPDGEKWAIRNVRLLGRSEDQTAFNLGIGYPF